ncbi:MAG: transcription-repair coupling factor [Pirellulaceae bacterium]|nr:transcription-repair coupling factor [Pirellulaceae bacterium]
MNNPSPKANSAPCQLLTNRLVAEEKLTDILQKSLSSHWVTIGGVFGSECALVAAAVEQLTADNTLFPTAGEPTVVVLPEHEEIDSFVDNLALFTAANVVTLPPLDGSSYLTSHQDVNQSDRIQLVKRLLRRTDLPNIVVTNIQSLCQPLPPEEELSRCLKKFTVGQEIDRANLIQWLVDQGFQRRETVHLPGEFSLKGYILDIYSADWPHPVRFEFFDEELESIRFFEILSQRSLEELSEIELLLFENKKEELPDFKDKKDNEVPPKKKTPLAKEHLGYYLPPGSLLLFVEPHELEEKGRLFLERVTNLEDYFTVRETFKRLKDFPTICLSELAEDNEKTLSLQFDSVQRFQGNGEEICKELDRSAKRENILCICQNEGEKDRLTEMFAETAAAQEGRLQLALGNLETGFLWPAQKQLLLTSHEMFQRKVLRREGRKHLGRAIDSFYDLKVGDLVVHLSHGIGRYLGLEVLEKNGQKEEHLALEFRGGTKIYVPTTKIQLIQKYIGGSKIRPRLAQIGGTSWQKNREAVEEAITDLASEMLELQAERSTRKGIVFKENSLWQHDFEASFPYTETPDQLCAIESVKEDLQMSQPMDRLICGDVGFGKTEVAIRAAFKAVDSGFQVAILVPTTILAEQHYQTFRSRLAEYPFEIARLSRFATRQEQKEVLTNLKNGSTDIVIGTHRLVSKDVKLANLGLVIIDEEQRFGVAVKEHLKILRATVNILTLSATPIPRTLHMALVGIRDISNLETAPAERIGIETRVMRFNENIIRQAIMHELQRSGQVFYVHNRVYDIEKVADKVRTLVPEATVRVGHGQMDEEELEKVMVDFVAGKFDILVATTIVESGLDIPNANTMIIDDAQRYGLADLHQLRGRVGRYKHRAYCYLCIDSTKPITPNAARRLRAIEEYSEMGAGFAISMRDLEIRGAGNLLGTEQSGHINLIGYELYCQLLETAIRQQKKLPPKLSLEVDIDLPGEAYFPETYVPDMRSKIDLYRRFSRVQSDNDLKQLKDELLDRFGKMPEPVKKLCQLTSLKMRAAIWQINAIYLEDRFVVFKYSNKKRMEQLVAHSKKIMKNLPSSSPKKERPLQNNRKKTNIPEANRAIESLHIRMVDDYSAYLPLWRKKELPGSPLNPDQLYKKIESVLPW